MASQYSETRLSRQRQIHTLRVFNENVEEVVEGSEYRVRFTSHSVALCLVVRLPPEFPDCAPSVFCSPALLHPWLGLGGRVTAAPGLQTFTPHSDLGMVVTAIRRELEKVAPTVVGGQGGVTPAPPPAMEYTPPAPGSDLIRQKLSQLGKEELQDILNDDGAFDKFMEELSYPALENIHENIRTMEANIAAAAEANLELQQQIETDRNSLLCKVQDFHAKKEEVEQVFAQLTELKQRVSGDILADKLVRLSVQNEEESDKIAERFLSKEIPVERFLQDYITIRQQGHVQKIKADRVKKLK